MDVLTKDFIDDADLKSHRVSRATSRDAFKRVIGGSAFACVYTDPDWKSDRQAFLEAYQKWDDANGFDLSARYQFTVRKKASGAMDLDPVFSKVPLRYPQIMMAELFAMAKLFAEMTGATSIDAFTEANVNFKPDHGSHAYPVLNRTLFAPGTVLTQWDSAVIGTVREGDYLFMAPRMCHYSTHHQYDPAVPDRISFIVKPTLQRRKY